jgi:hypothetical protein
MRPGLSYSNAVKSRPTHAIWSEHATFRGEQKVSAAVFNQNEIHERGV